MDQRKIGAFIKEMRKELGLTQSQLAEKLSISNKAISKWETGGGMPDVSLIAPLCQALHITSEELFAGRRASLAQGAVQPVKTKKRYDIIMFVILFVLITVILVFLIFLLEKLETNRLPTVTPTTSTTVTNEALPTHFYTPTETVILTPTSTLVPTIEPTPTKVPTPTLTDRPTATPTQTAKPTAAPTTTSTATQKTTPVPTPTSTPTPIGETVLSIDFEDPTVLNKFSTYKSGDLDLVSGNTGNALKYSNASYVWNSPMYEYGDIFKDGEIYFFECDLCFTELNALNKTADGTGYCIYLVLRIEGGSYGTQYAHIAKITFWATEGEWVHVSAVMDTKGKYDYTGYSASYENYRLFGFDSIAGDTVNGTTLINTFLIDNLVITRQS